MGKDQYHPSAEPSAKNRLFTMYHAQYSKHERRRIVDELVNGKSSHHVLFVTVWRLQLGLTAMTFTELFTLG